MPDPSKEELLQTPSREFDPDTLSFVGPRGDRAAHLDRAALVDGLAAIEPNKDEGLIELMVARGPKGERVKHRSARLTTAGGMPGDRWADANKSTDSQLATTNSDIAKLIANGQPLALHGDNLFISLDLSEDNLPAGSRVRVGSALLEVTTKPHNGCKKWVQRFGLDVMQLNLDAAWRARNLRGIYFAVVEEGVVNVGDRVVVISR